jgi:hypothetical protein
LVEGRSEVRGRPAQAVPDKGKAGDLQSPPIKNGTVIDGTAALPFRADIGEVFDLR